MFCCFSSWYVYESLMYFTLLVQCDFFFFQYWTFPFARGFFFSFFFSSDIVYECFVTLPCICKTNEINIRTKLTTPIDEYLNTMYNLYARIYQFCMFYNKRTIKAISFFFTLYWNSTKIKYTLIQDNQGN